jgi:ATP-dependent RNA helicase SUPV3L1/SUV3
VPMVRARISRYIEQALLTQAGFGDTTKEVLYGYR